MNAKKLAPKIARYLLGLMFAVFGVIGLFNLIQPPPDLPEKLQAFMAGMNAAPYFFPFLKLTETVCGLLLLIGIAPALALIILAPITIQIVLLHGYFTPTPKDLLIPILILVLHILSATAYWDIYKPLFGKNPR